MSVTDWHPDYDWLIMGAPGSRQHADLLTWKEQTPDLHDFLPDYHRLQVEAWLWMAWQSGRMAGLIMDIGADTPRRWMGRGYRTFGERDCDIIGDVTAITGIGDAIIGTVVCTEVLEHVAEPGQAVAELHRILEPGGRLFVTSPFYWPEHGREGLYRDYWRFTRDGWAYLMRDFSQVTITAADWTREGTWLYHMLRQHEGWGLAGLVSATTGYLVEATK